MLGFELKKAKSTAGSEDREWNKIKSTIQSGYTTYSGGGDIMVINQCNHFQRLNYEEKGEWEDQTQSHACFPQAGEVIRFATEKVVGESWLAN